MRSTKMKKNWFIKKGISLCLTGVMLLTMPRVSMMAAETDNNVANMENFADEIDAAMKAAGKQEKASAPAQQIELGIFCTGVLTRDGNLYTWGSNNNGNLGNGTKTDSNVPIKIMENVKCVSMGGTYGGAIKKDGSLYMWGSNRTGELGNGTTQDSSVPVKIMENVESVSFAHSHGICRALTKDGGLYTWGWNQLGHLGNGTTTSKSVPVKILNNVETICSCDDDTGAITKDGSLYMWGRNQNGQLGDGTTKDRLKPVKVMDNVKSASLGGDHAGAITRDGSLYMWGLNDSGQLGNGTTSNSNVPVKVMDNVESVISGYKYTGAITKNGELYMWGSNNSGRLGNGATSNSNVPVKVMDDVLSVRLDGVSNAAITEDGSLYMWGESIPLGSSMENGSFVPVKILENVQCVNLDLHSGAITKDGNLYMWGRNGDGQLGDGTTTDSLIPKIIDFFNLAFDESIYRASWISDTGCGLDTIIAGTDTPAATIYNEAENSGLATAIDGWNLMQDTLGAVLDDPSGLLDVPLEKKDVYEGIIFSLFETAADVTIFPMEDLGKSAVKETNSLLSLIKTGMKTKFDIDVGNSYDLSTLTEEQKESMWDMYDDYFKSKGISKASKYVSNISKAVNYFKEAESFVEYSANCMAIMELGESYKATMQAMYDACPASNLALKSALLDCVTTMDMSMEAFAVKMGTCTAITVGKDFAKNAIKKLWGDVKTTITRSKPYVALIWASYKSSTYFCDKVFGTSAIAEKTVKLGALADVQKLAFSVYKNAKAGFTNDVTRENADEFLSAIDVCYNYLDEDCDGAYKFVETVSDTLAARIQALFGRNNNADLMAQINAIKAEYDNDYENLNIGWLYGLEVDYPEECDNYKDIMKEWEKKYNIACPVDVYVYNGVGELMASVVGNMPYCADDSKFSICVEGDEKEILLYDNTEKYTFKYVATGTGTMDITIEENVAVSGNERIVKHVDVPLAEGMTYTAEEKWASDNNTYELTEMGNESNVITPIVDTADETLPQYTLTVNQGYMADGGGIGHTSSFYAGEKVTVYANAPEGYKLKKWTSDVAANVFEDANAEAAIITMPARDVELTATFDVAKSTPILKFASDNVVKTYGDAPFTNTLTATTDGTVAYHSGNDSVAVVNEQTGEVTIQGVGKTVITANAAEGADYEAGSASYQLTVDEKPAGNGNGSNLQPNDIAASNITVDANASKPQTISIGAKAKGGSLTYQSDSSKITVDRAGNVTVPQNHAGQAIITITADGGGFTTVTKTITVTVKQIDNIIIASNIIKAYSKKAQTASIVAKRSGNGKLTYSSNNKYITVDSSGKVKIKAKYIGRASITIKSAAFGIYKATSKKITVTVNPAKTSISRLSSKQKGFNLSWKRNNAATGYQVQYSTSKKFKKSATKTKLVKKNSVTKLNVRKLKAKTAYYVRIRVYKTVSGKKYYSDWSAVKSVRIK